MMPPQLNLHQIKVMFELLTKHPFILNFFKPLNKKFRFWTISVSVIIGIALYVFVDIELAEVVRQNSHPIHMLSAELLRELGPEYVRASREHADMIDQYYNKHLKQRRLAAVLRVLFPRLSPEKALASVKEALDKSAEEEKAKKAIWQAGVTSNQLYKLGKRFPRSPIQWFESEVVSNRLLSDLDIAFDTFHGQVNNLENAKTLEAAENECRNGCICSRKALLLLSLARLGYDNKENKIESFLNDLTQAHKKALLFAEKYKSKKKLFSDRAENMHLRAEVAEAMLANDMDRASELLREVIEIALKKHKDNTTE